MATGSFASWMLAQEARALLTRLARVKPFALHEPMVPAAGISPLAQTAIERHLAEGRRELRGRVHRYLGMVARSRRANVPRRPRQQRRFTFLRLRFNAVLSQFDLFADVLTQRSEHETGVWLVRSRRRRRRRPVAAGIIIDAPSVICYLDRGRRRRDSPGAHAAAGRRRESGGRSSACRVSAWWAAVSPLRWCTRSGTRRRRCSISSIPYGRCCRRAATGDNRGWLSGNGGSRRSSPTSGRWRG